MVAMIDDDFSSDLSRTVREFRAERGLTVTALARASDVSRAMISKIESNEVQPTAALLARLSAAFGVTLSELIGHAETSLDQIRRSADQRPWVDPGTGYTRWAVSPPISTNIEIVRVELPAGAEVASPAASYDGIDQQIWVRAGTLEFHEGDQVHTLEQGDCLQLGAPQDCLFRSATGVKCEYVVVLSKRFSSRPAG